MQILALRWNRGQKCQTSIGFKSQMKLVLPRRMLAEFFLNVCFTAYVCIHKLLWDLNCAWCGCLSIYILISIITLWAFQVGLSEKDWLMVVPHLNLHKSVLCGTLQLIWLGVWGTFSFHWQLSSVFICTKAGYCSRIVSGLRKQLFPGISTSATSKLEILTSAICIIQAKSL